MALGYGYVKRDEPQQIDWGTIGKEMTDFIKSDQESRTKRKEEIQNQYSELTKSLIDKPVGYNTDLNDVISSYADQASIAALSNLNKLKSGEISERDYYNKRANLKSSTENFFLYSKNFNSKLDENMKLAQSQDPNKRASGKMIYQMGLAQDMFDFKNTKAIIDPITDELILVKTDENGNPTNEVVNVSQLGTLSSEQELEYNYRQEIQNRIKGSGTKKYTDRNGREVITILGAEIGSEQATKTIDSLTNSILGDENQMISILDQNGFEYTQDENLKGKDGYIYYDIKNGTYDYDKDKAREIVKNEITNSIPETVIEVQELTANEKELERLKIQDARNSVEKGNIELKGLRADDIDTSNLQAEVKRDINETVGSDIASTFDTNYYSLAGGAKKKGSNAVKSSLDLLNRYASGFGTTITEDGTYMYFTTDAFDASGKPLAKPIEIKYSLENITDGNTVTALLENFITLYPADRFIKNAYKTGRFNPGTGTQVTGTQATGTQATGTQVTGTQATGTQATGTQATDTTTVVETQTDEFGIPINTTTTPTETVQTTTETAPTSTVIEKNVTKEEVGPGVIKAKRRNWINKVKALLNEKTDGDPVFDKSILQRIVQMQSMENALSVDKKYGGKVADKFLTEEFARLYPDYPHQIYGQTKIFGKAKEIEATKKQKEAERKKQRKNRIEKGKLLNNYFGEMEELIDLVAKEAGRNLSIEEQVEIEKGNLPAIDFSETFKKKYSYLFD